MSEVDRRLQARLHSRADRVEVAADAWARLEERLAGTDGPRRPRPVPLRLAAGVATAAVVALAVLAAQDLLRPDTRPEIAPMVGDAEGDRAAGWHRREPTAEPPPGTGELSVNDVLATGEQILVAADGGTLWRSTDRGRSFARTEEAAFALEDGIADLHALTRTHDGVLVAGGTATRGGLWHTSDGATFTRVELPGTGPLHDVLATQEATVAVGHDGAGPAAFVSRRGEAWRRAEVGDEGASDVVALSTLAHGPSGWVAIGSPPDGGGGATFWHSASALSWQPTAPVEGQPSDVVEDIAVYDERFHALRSDGTVLTSSDGRTWRSPYGDGHLVPDDDHGGAGATVSSTQRFAGIAKLQFGWLALGGEVGPDRPPRVFTSPDTRRWDAATLDDRGDVQTMTVLADGTILAAGRDDACRGRRDCPEHAHDLVLWHHPPG